MILTTSQIGEIQSPLITAIDKLCIQVPKIRLLMPGGAPLSEAASLDFLDRISDLSKEILDPSPRDLAIESAKKKMMPMQ